MCFYRTLLLSEATVKKSSVKITLLLPSHPEVVKSTQLIFLWKTKSIILCELNWIKIQLEFGLNSR